MSLNIGYFWAWRPYKLCPYKKEKSVPEMHVKTKGYRTMYISFIKAVLYIVYFSEVNIQILCILKQTRSTKHRNQHPIAKSFSRPAEKDQR